ncbi:hypothetical protein PG997_000734 [Apiospora hydei]|uniref:Cnl2/NKP2 family protein-domain-containing protein n=1 Tax=Apiospora hydei TaxID=1337664 RepID=A0ABR1XBP1_9PEZI
MAPTEATILQNYLLLPSSLPTILSLQEFTSYFPKSQRSSPQIRALYRDLQRQRNNVVEAVSSNIDSEVKQGRALRRALFGPTSRTIRPKKHTLMTILPELDAAAIDMEQEIQKLEEEEAAMLQLVKQTIGNMSDLRYGRFANSKLQGEVLDGLNSIQEVCKSKT